MKTYTILALGLLFIIQSCDEPDQEPYIVFKDSDAKEITIDTIEVESESVQELLIETGFHGSSPRYLRQINNGEIINITTSDDVYVLSHGFSNIDFEKVELTTNISEMNLASGSIIRTTARIETDLSKSIYYKIK
ncbi:hypothetical protein ABWH96_03260 [Marivirga tractuosa]|uniref:hypothetical protein n=1 Tax=Marivirga tractuosa TaxID=1006 RepID=UPI0035CECB44